MAINNFPKIVLPEEHTAEILEVLSAGKTPRKDGKENEGTIHKARIPFSDCMVTHGRKAIRDIFNRKDFVNMTYR